MKSKNQSTGKRGTFTMDYSTAANSPKLHLQVSTRTEGKNDAEWKEKPGAARSRACTSKALAEQHYVFFRTYIKSTAQ